MSQTLLSPEELEAALRKIGAERYHNKHRFHARQYSGKCTYEEIQAWALNRYYYQSMIPIKDAIVLTRLSDAEDRRQWRKRIEDHDGLKPGDGGIERWLKLTDSLGFPRDYVESTAGILPATRFAVDAYVAFVRDKSPVEAVASSLGGGGVFALTEESLRAQFERDGLQAVKQAYMSGQLTGHERSAAAHWLGERNVPLPTDGAKK